MKLRNFAPLLLLFLGSLLLVGCSETEVTHTFSGTVDKILVEEGVIVVKEITEDEDENLHKVAVNNIEHYEVGQEVEVTINKSDNSQQSQLEITE